MYSYITSTSCYILIKLWIAAYLKMDCLQNPVWIDVTVTLRSQNSTFTPLTLSSMRLSNADHTKNPLGKELKDFVLDQCVLYLFSNLKTICTPMTISFTQLSPTLTLLPFQILWSAWYKLTALCDVGMIQDNYQSILLLQNRSQYLALFTKYVTWYTFKK